MNKKIVAFVGVIGSGKDYQCNLLEQKGYKRIAFADTLRELTWRVFNWQPKDNFEYEEFKKQIFTAAGYPSFTGREILQRLGTDSRKIISDDIWLTALEKKIENDPSDNFCISDLRFQNEFEFIKNLTKKGYEVDIVFTNYKSDRYKDNDPHESEHLAQEFLKQGRKDLEYLYHDFKIGDMVRITKLTSLPIYEIGKVYEITNIYPFASYQYYLDDSFGVSPVEIELVSDYKP